MKTHDFAPASHRAGRIDFRFVIEPAQLPDAERILYLQRLAYLPEAERYREWQIPPLTESVKQMHAEFDRQVFLQARVDHPRRIVGSVRGRLDDGTCHIGRLIVHPDHQGRGLGSALLRAIEQHFAQARRFELFTGHRSTENLHFYERRGYRRFREQRMSERLTLVFLEKTRDIPAEA